MGLMLIALAVAGAVVTLLVNPQASVWVAIAAGFVLLSFSLAGGRQRSATRA
jgi:4-hydroxybenzoate polyprenyltransferase